MKSEGFRGGSEFGSLDREHDIRYWTQKLGVSEAALTAAVAKVGSSVEALRRELHRGM
jgi:hypothetical protein